MKHINPFFVIGSIGMIITSVLHIFLAVVLSLPAVHSAFFAVYPGFFAFMVIGFGQLLRKQRQA